MRESGGGRQQPAAWYLRHLWHFWHLCRVWRAWLCVGCAALVAAPGAHAALGGPASGALADGRPLAQAHALRAAGAAQVSDTTVIDVSGVTVHEYSGSDGVVFAIAWSGATIPDLRQLLGSYFPGYQAGLRARPAASYRAAVRLRTPQIVAHAAGHMRAYFGSAYAPALVPAGVDLASLGVQP